MTHARRLTGGVLALTLAATAVTGIDQRAAAAPDAPRAAAGAQTSGDSLFPAQGNGGYDVSHYGLALSYVASGAITATATIEAATTGGALSQYSFDLEGLTVSAVTVDGTPAASFSRVAAAPAYKLVVTPATPVSGSFTTVVTYSGTPVSHTDPDDSSEGWNATTGGAVALNEPVGAMTWYPVNNTPRDKATFTTAITVPYSSILPIGNRTAVSNGTLAPPTTTSSTRTFTWDQPEQQAPYLALVAIGSYTGAQSDVALTSGSTHEWSYTRSSIADATSTFSTRRGELSAILQSIEDSYGPYPGSSTGIVVDSSSLGYALETQDRPYFENTIDQETLIHELAHQWYGDAVSPADWSDVWLNEGPATFIATQVTAALYAGASTESTFYDLWSSTAANSTRWQTPVAGFTDATKLFDWQVYNRGAMVLEALRTAVGAATFSQIMRTYLERFGGGTASTADFIALSEELSGRDLTAFFQDWVYDADKPAWPAKFDLSLASSPATGSTVEAGDHVDYTVSAVNTGKVAMTGSVVALDVADLVAGATLDALPPGVTRSGTTLRWAVPSTAKAATSTVTIGATLDHLSSSSPIGVTARATTLGGTCTSCTSTLPVHLVVLSPSPTPTIAGTPRTDQRLTATVGTWDPQASLAYQWLRDGNAIPGATGLTYRLNRFDVGARVGFAVTGSAAGFPDAVELSDPTTRVAPGVQSRRPRPSIKGTAKVGRTVRAAAGKHDRGTRVGFRWYVGKKPLKGATHASYRIGRQAAGKRLKVRTIVTKPGYRTVSRASKPTQRVHR